MEKIHSVVCCYIAYQALVFVGTFLFCWNEMVVLPLGAGKTSENCIGLCLVRGEQQHRHHHNHHQHQLRPQWSQQSVLICHIYLHWIFFFCTDVQPMCDIERSPISLSLSPIVHFCTSRKIVNLCKFIRK